MSTPSTWLCNGEAPARVTWVGAEQPDPQHPATLISGAPTTVTAAGLVSLGDIT